jgi:hypothetical protein
MRGRVCSGIQSFRELHDTSDQIDTHLQFILQKLAYIVRFPERRLAVHYNVQFADIVLAEFRGGISSWVNFYSNRKKINYTSPE